MQHSTSPGKLVPFACLLSTVFSGCSTGWDGMRSTEHVPIGETRNYTSFEKCPSDTAGRESGGIALMVLSLIGQKMLTNVGKVIAEGAKAGNLTATTGVRNLSLPRGTLPNCVVIVRGQFSKHPNVSNQATLEKYGKHFQRSGELSEFNNRILALGLDDVTRLDQVIELRVFKHQYKPTISFGPLYVGIFKSADGAMSGPRNATVTLKFSGPDTKMTESSLALPDLTVGKPDPVMMKDANGRHKQEAPWFGVDFGSPPQPPTTAVDVQNRDIASQNQSATTTTRVSEVPITLTTTVSEYRPTNEGLNLFSLVFSSLQDVANEELGNLSK